MSDQPRFRQPDEIFCHNCGLLIKRDSRFCMHCGVQVPGAPALDVTTPGAPLAGLAALPPFPLRYEVAYPEKLSRLLIFIKLILAIPHFLVLYALNYVTSVVTLIAFFAILFTKRYPTGLFNLVVGFHRWGANVAAYAGLLRDEYPPFSPDRDKYPVTYEVAHPENVNRWLPLVKWLVVMPNQIVFSFVQFAAFFVYVVAWFAILFTGRLPRGMFGFIAGVIRWQQRTTAYTGLLRDEYPPYSTASDAKPGGRASIIIGAVAGPLLVTAFVGGFFALAFTSGSAKEVAVSYEAIRTGSSSPRIDIGGTDVTLLRAEDPYMVGSRSPAVGSRFVALVLRIKNRDSIFTSISEETFRLEDSSGRGHDPAFAVVRDSTVRSILSRGEEVVATVVFEMDARYNPADLTYSPRFVEVFGTRLRFVFR